MGRHVPVPVGLRLAERARRGEDATTHEMDPIAHAAGAQLGVEQTEVCSYWGRVSRAEFGSLYSDTQSGPGMPWCSSRSVRTSAKRGMFCIPNANVPPCHATSIVACARFASCTVRTNEAIRSGSVHSLLLKNTRTFRGPSANTLASRPGRSGGGPLMSANTCWLNCPPKPAKLPTRPRLGTIVNSGALGDGGAWSPAACA